MLRNVGKYTMSWPSDKGQIADGPKGGGGGKTIEKELKIGVIRKGVK